MESVAEASSKTRVVEVNRVGSNSLGISVRTTAIVSRLPEQVDQEAIAATGSLGRVVRVESA